jgi:hypothetical protein
MTIVVGIQTNTAAIFAADSRLSTKAFVGFDAAGEPQFVKQTYENATKIVHDTDRLAMAAIAGSATLGPVGVLDYIASSAVPRAPAGGDQEALLKGFADGMAKLRAEFWRDKKLAEDRWPRTVVMLALAPTTTRSPQMWRIDLLKEEPSVSLIRIPVYLEGTYDSAMSLLYGYHGDVMDALAKELKIGEQTIGEEAIYDLLRSNKVLSPIDKLAVGVMPVQDAVELACFLATVQIQMERFLPGDPYCGGPLDVMVLKTAPSAEIVWLPGKLLHHPQAGSLDTAEGGSNEGP